MRSSYWLLAIGSWPRAKTHDRFANGQQPRAKSCLWAVVAMAALACGPSQPNTDVRQWTDNYAIRISVDPMPPEALEPAIYKVVVRDRETNQPIENGEGRIFATSPDGANTDDGLAKGKEIGTYYARLFYVISGDWAIAIQFRRDSTQRLERADWIQNVRPSTKPGY